MKRFFDIFLSIVVGTFLFLPITLIAMAVLFTSRGPIIYWSDRIGVNNSIFRMPKFRSMLIGTPVLATHLLSDPEAYLTPIGSFLRRNSLDELPQLWSIFIGDMSFVGPRPALFNQDDLIILRAQYGVDKLTPGLTGWAQVNGRDEISIQEKVDFDIEYLNNKNIYLDIKIIWLTFLKVIKHDGIAH